MSNNNNINTQTSGSPYDDVYRTLIVDCPRLLIPVINEIFHKNFDENTLTVKFPNTAVLYLRYHQNTPDAMTVSIQVPGDECHYQVPVMKIGTYSIDDIFEKKLYFLIPFHIFVYEKQFQEYDSNEQKLAELKTIYEQMIQTLAQVAKQGLLTELNKHMIIEMSKKVLNQISKKYGTVQKGIGDIMGGKVLDYEAKDIYRSGVAEEMAQGAARGVAQGKTLGIVLAAIVVKIIIRKFPEQPQPSDIEIYNTLTPFFTIAPDNSY